MTAETSAPRKGFLASLGPAIITASVVLGPGSILANSTTGASFGYQMAWVLVVAVALMIGMTALSTRLGVLMQGTMGDEVARRAGRPWAVLVGLTIFLIASCFQFSNNLGVLAAVEPFLDEPAAAEETADSAPAEAETETAAETEAAAGLDRMQMIKLGVVGGINLLAICAVLFARELYRDIEKLMKFLVGIMVVGFVGNLVLARPDIMGILQGFIPSLPEGATETILPKRGVNDNFRPVVAMIGTTFSVAAAFYQSYLVREKGWTKADYRTGITDTLTGIGMLGFISLVIMCTASAAFHDNPDSALPGSPSAADFARQLEPTFGASAKYLFCAGIFAGAVSSFLVNALIGGALLADGCGQGGRMEDRPVRIYTIAALLLGMAVASWMIWEGARPVRLIIFAQSATVVGVPAVALVMLWLATRPDLKRDVPPILILVAVVSLVITIFLAVRTAMGIYFQLSG